MGPFLRLAHRLRRRLDGDARIAIVAGLAAITVHAITMSATASSVIRALQVARDSRETVVAANIAQVEMEKLRAIPFNDWAFSNRVVGAGQTLTDTYDGVTDTGIDYVVTREA